MLFSRLSLGFLLLLCVALVGCGPGEATVVPEDPSTANLSDAEGSFPDADAEEMKQMEEAAGAGETP